MRQIRQIGLIALFVLALCAMRHALCADRVIGSLQLLRGEISGSDVVIVEPAGGASYWTDPNAADLIVHLDYEGTNAATTLDVGPNGLHLTNYPTVATGPAWQIAGTNVYGRVERCYHMDSSDDNQRAFASFTLFSNSAWTVCYWVNADSDDADFNFGGSLSRSDADGNDFSFTYPNFSASADFYDAWGRANATFRWRLQSAAGSATNSTTGCVGAWRHLAIVHDGTSPKMFVDGTQLTVTTNVSTDMTYTWSKSFGTATIPNTICLGAFYENSTCYDPFGGLMDDVRIYKSARSTADLLEIVSKTHPTNNLESR